MHWYIRNFLAILATTVLLTSLLCGIAGEEFTLPSTTVGLVMLATIAISAYLFGPEFAERLRGQ